MLHLIRRASILRLLSLSCLILIALLASGMVSSRPPVALAACSGEEFVDVCPPDWFYQHVLALHDLGAISGYADDTFRPYHNITRGQAMKVIVSALALDAPLSRTNTFADATSSNPFYRWIEIGAALQLAGGYDCGASSLEPCDSQQRPYFRPAADVSRGQLAKIVVSARGWDVLMPDEPTFSDVAPNNPFFGQVERAAANEIISGYSDGSFRPFQPVTRAQASKMIDLARLRQPTPTVTGTPPTATPSRTPTPPATATRTATSGSPQIAGCPVFPANNIWNRNIADLPVHRLSDAYIASIGLDEGVHPDFGSGTWEGRPIGIPYTTVPGSQPGVNVTFRYNSESDRPPYPIPPDAPIEGGPDADGDRHILVVDRDNCVLHELFAAYPNEDGSWRAGSGARWSLLSNALRPDGWTSADAAGLPILPGLARHPEVAAGAIRHALRFTAPETQQAYIWPARHHASDLTDPNLPPMGLRVRLKASVDVSGYSPQTRIILQALKDYGMFLSDNGSPWYIIGEPDENWDNDSLVGELSEITGSDFEAVDESHLMIDPNSGESR